MDNLKCKVCKRTPEEIGEYVSEAEVRNLTADQFVEQEEGTLNRDTNRFYCTGCYIKIGMPLGVA